MANSCNNVVIKSECHESVDTIVVKTLEGPVRIMKQGGGIKTTTLTVAGDLPSGKCTIYGDGCSGAAEVETIETEMEGTPYKISTIRCAM